MLKFVKENQHDESSDISYTSNELAFYRQMSTQADLQLQKDLLQESRLMKVVLKSKKNLELPKNGGN